MASFMKQIIIALFLGLIVIVHGKELSHYSDTQIVHTQAPVFNGMSAPFSTLKTDGAMHFFSKTNDSRNEAETINSANTIPSAEPKTMEKGTSNETVTDWQTVSQTASISKTKQITPAAVPIATPEEAEKANEFALFLATVKKTVVEGEIIERSELPDPQESDYPNCRFTVHFNGNTIKSGEPCPKELSLIVEGFENYRVLPNNDIKTGDKVRCTIVPFDMLPEDYQSTQQADDLELFLLENYYTIAINKISDFTDSKLIPSSGIFFTDNNDDYISIIERHINPPISERIQSAQNKSIQNELDKMNDLLNGYDDAKIEEINKIFAEAWRNEQEKDAPGCNRIKDYVWRNIDNSFWTLPQDYTLLKKPEELSPMVLKCFSSLKKVLEENGVQLIVSLVPDLYDISSRVINHQFRDIPDIQAATYVKQLSEIGIETIYASDSILQNFNKYPFAFFYPSNYHPSDTTQDVLSDLLAERLKRYDIPRSLDSNLFSETQSAHCYKDEEKYLFPAGCDIGKNIAGTSYTCRKILYNGKNVSRSKESSVIVIGNSFIQTPVSPDSFPSLLSYKLCSGIDWYNINALGPFSDILIRLLANPDTYLKNKRVLIMHVGTTHLSRVNRYEIMLDIIQLDREQTLLNKKKMQDHFFLQSNVSVDRIVDPKLWGPLSTVEKTVLRIDKNGELSYSFTIDHIGDGISDSKPLVCVIPHCCTRKTPCEITINGTKKTMQCPNYARNARFFNLAYELPAGTKEITITIEGKPGAFVAIKDIQIWQ